MLFLLKNEFFLYMPTSIYSLQQQHCPLLHFYFQMKFGYVLLKIYYGSQVPVTLTGFEPQSSYIQCSYITHQVLGYKDFSKHFQCSANCVHSDKHARNVHAKRFSRARNSTRITELFLCLKANNIQHNNICNS